MRIHKIRIQNFRGIEDMTLELDPKLTVLVGANNAGKTTVLDALEAIVGFPKTNPVFLDTDFRATTELADPRDLKPIELTVEVVPSAGDQFAPGELPDGINAQLKHGKESVRLRLVASFKIETQAVDTKLRILDHQDQEIGEWARFPFKEGIPHHNFGPERDIRRGMTGRWTDWRALLNDVRPARDTLQKASDFFKSGSEALLAAGEFQSIKDGLKPGGRAVGVAEASLSASPQDPSELLDRLYVELKLPGAPRGFSADRHGLGTQGAMLFQIFKLRVENLRKTSAAVPVSPLVTIEEPEAHLHPTAQRSMAREIGLLPGQVLVTSHSPDFVNASTGKIALLRMKAGVCEVREVGSSEKLFRQHPRAVFARALILVEGSEAEMFPSFSQAMGVDLGAEGVEVINAGGQKTLASAWRLFADQLGIPTVCLGDADDDVPLANFFKMKQKEAWDNQRKASLVSDFEALDYFTCPYGECIEEELVKASAECVEQVLVQLEATTTADWLKDDKPKLGKKWAKRLGVEDPTRAELKKQPDLARVFRLTLNKAEYPRSLASLLTNEGQDASLVPERFKKAIRRAVLLAGS